jgi:hypothetical protein
MRISRAEPEHWSSIVHEHRPRHGCSTAAPRRYFETFWREPVLGAAITDAGWAIDEVLRYEGMPEDYWLSVRAKRL